jgi:DNA repair photolyase
MARERIMTQTIILKADGVLLKGCNDIYAPRGQAGEYAALAANIYRGRGHCCAYCYVPGRVIKNLTRAEFDSGAVLRPSFMKGLRKDAVKYQAAGITEQVMLSFTSDPWHRGDVQPTLETLQVLIEHGLAFCTLTKGGTRGLQAIDMFRPNRDAVAVTLTSLNDRFSQKWERLAALPGDRIAGLRAFHDRGIFTSAASSSAPRCSPTPRPAVSPRKTANKYFRPLMPRDVRKRRASKPVSR